MELAGSSMPDLKEKSKGKGKTKTESRGDAKPTDNVRCPLGCKTTGYESTTRYHEHLLKTHSFPKEFMKQISGFVRRNCRLSLGEKWKGTYQMIFPQETTVPPPYIHSPDEYKSASRNPHQAILERIKGNIRDSVIPAPMDWWFSLSEEEMDRYLRNVWLPVVPSFLDSVDEEGLYQSRPYVAPIEQYANLFDGDNENTGAWPVPNE